LMLWLMPHGITEMPDVEYRFYPTFSTFEIDFFCHTASQFNF
jgi:hypothetical protein